MPDFKESQLNLQTIRLQRRQVETDLFQVRERLKRLAEERRRFDRYFNQQNEQHRAQRQRLDRLQAAAESQLEKLQTTLAGVKERELGYLGVFQPFTDPREFLGQLNDRTPFLLFPLRLETRFKKVNVAGGVRDQLWVRIYPDDAAIDTFEETLSEAEILNAQTYWFNYWKAGGVEDQERAAWRGLVSGHGSGRAYYITQQYPPVTPLADRPAKADPGDLILVIGTQTTLAEPEKNAIAAYWIAAWRAGDDKAKLDAAWATLVGAVGATRAGEIADTLRPVNFTYEPPAGADRETLPVQLAVLQFKDVETEPSKQQPWTQAPKSYLMPDRFFLLGYRGQTLEVERIGNPVPSPLVVGPDPLAQDDQQLKPVDGDLQVGDEMRWMVDFDEAVRIGMGFRIDLTATQARAGFDRLFVVGLRLSGDATESQTQLEQLFRHHQHSRRGFGLLSQGTPTNNTEQMPSGLSRLDDPDVSFNNYFLQGDLFTETADPFAKLDGQWLADYLGLDPAVFKKSYHADGRDQCEARAMNSALWPATMGYFMKSMLPPVLNDTTIEQTRTFFRHFVLGRGPVPAIRIGQQPYGILPTAAFSRLNWMRRDLFPPGAPDSPNSSFAYLRGLYEVLLRIESDWSALLPQVPYVGKSGDAHQILLDVLGLHPASVEFYQRYAESFQQLYNRLNLQGLGGAFLALLLAGAYVEGGMNLLRKLGYDDSQQEDGVPDILEKFFLGKQNLLKRDLIDDQPLSESAPIRAYTTDEKNYLYWLIQAANTSHDALRKQEGFKDGKIPTALLYLMLHYALDQSFFKTSLDLHLRAELYDSAQVARLHREPSFLYVDGESSLSGASKWSSLYQAEARITDSPDLLIGEYIARIIPEDPLARQLRDQLAGLEHLKDTPTARLERAFVEHLDACTYRLDAWKQGLLTYQLNYMRRSPAGGPASARGIYLGAYGWLEEVRPENKQLTPVELPEDLAAIFGDDTPLVRDNTNAGYIHAPSINHAVTAAVLRNGYLSNATPQNPDTLAVNLSSERVRLALSFIEGIRNGQSLAALLGYQLERGLHDRYALQLDQFIYELRRVFPLYANRLAPTRAGATVPIRQVEARNVVNGLDLINHIKNTGLKTYPFGKDLPVTGITLQQRQAIEREVDKLIDIHDAIADLAMAESVHQVVQNNYDRAAATLDTYSKGNFPPIPEVVQTPRSGTTLTHRVGIQLPAGLSPGLFPDTSPRAKAEPALNQWLSQVLPAPSDMACTLVYFDHLANAEVRQPVTMADLGLEPIDVLYLVRLGDDQALTGLDDRLLQYAVAMFAPRPDAEVRIEYAAEAPGKFPLFELAPLLDSLRSVALRSRPLRPGDVLLPNEATESVEQDVTLDPARITSVRSLLQNFRTNELQPLLTTIEPLVDVEDITANQEAIIADLESWVDSFAGLAVHAGRFDPGLAPLGDLYQRLRGLYGALRTKVQDRIDRWAEQLTQYDGLIATYEGLPVDATDAERFALLQQAERLVAGDGTLPLPATPAQFRTNVLDVRHAAFLAKKAALENVLAVPYPSVKTLRNAIRLELPLTAFDLLDFTIADEDQQLLVLAADLLARLRGMLTTIDDKLAKSQDLLDQYNSSAAAPEQVQALQDAGKALLGEEFLMIPEFGVPAAAAEEWEKAWLNRAQLLDFQHNELGVDFPVDDWLHSLARVREKMHHWENVVLMGEAFDPAATPLALDPLQFPYQADDRWLGLTFKKPDEDFAVSGHRLLYAAHYTTEFDKTARQCGLLVDEWTEVLPTTSETTGITFHYDRPNAEPPQVMLLVMPTDFRNGWQWADIVDALHETLDAAKQRAVEPVQIDATPYARFLPATISAVTLHPITIALNYAFNNQVYAKLEG